MVINSDRILETLIEGGADYCDVRKEKWDEMSMDLKDGEIERMTRGVERGAMVRVLYEGGWGSVGTSDLDSMDEAAERSISIAKSSNEFKKEETGLADTEVQKDEVEIEMDEDPQNVPAEEKISFLRNLEDKLDVDFVDSTELRYREAVVEKEIYSSEGTKLRMKIPRIITSITVTGKGKSIQRASESTGGTGGYELMKGAYEKTDIVLDRLKSLLEADTPPSGTFPLIMDPDLAGVFVHEAFGHAAEGDLVSSGNSCLEGKLGEMVAAENVTIRDDPTMDGYGHFPYDDEGTKAQNRVLVKDGKLNDFILDRESAWKLGIEPNGGARAEDFRVKPLVRMSNTVVEPGEMKRDELFEEVDRGVYAKSSSGGQVNPAEGTFQFNAQEAYLVKDGEIVKPLRDVSFNGFTLETLRNVVGLTDELETGAGYCGKGQLARVSHGGPHVLISEVTVGGRE